MCVGVHSLPFPNMFGQARSRDESGALRVYSSSCLHPQVSEMNFLMEWFSVIVLWAWRCSRYCSSCKSFMGCVWSIGLFSLGMFILCKVKQLLKKSLSLLVASI